MKCIKFSYPVWVIQKVCRILLLKWQEYLTFFRRKKKRSFLNFIRMVVTCDFLFIILFIYVLLYCYVLCCFLPKINLRDRFLAKYITLIITKIMLVDTAECKIGKDGNKILLNKYKNRYIFLIYYLRQWNCCNFQRFKYLTINDQSAFRRSVLS